MWKHSENSQHTPRQYFLNICSKPFRSKSNVVQTDNGPEFTKHYGSRNSSALTMFEKRLEEHGIRHKDKAVHTKA